MTKKRDELSGTIVFLAHIYDKNQEEVAEACGMTPKTLRKKLKDSGKFTLRELQLLAIFFGTDVISMMNGEVRHEVRA